MIYNVELIKVLLDRQLMIVQMIKQPVFLKKKRMVNKSKKLSITIPTTKNTGLGVHVL